MKNQKHRILFYTFLLHLRGASIIQMVNRNFFYTYFYVDAFRSNTLDAGSDMLAAFGLQSQARGRAYVVRYASLLS